MNRPRTKIVATLGPASAKPEVLARLLDAGVSVLRINFSHGSPEAHAEYIRLARQLAGDRPVAIMGDLTGPKIRVGLMQEGGLPLAAGDTLTIQRAPILGAAGVISTNLPCLVDDLDVGQRVLLDDGAIRLLVIEKAPDLVRCQVIHGGLLLSNKGLNLPHTRLNLPSITEKDWADAAFAVDHKLDYLALSFVRNAEEITELRQYLDSRGSRMGVVAKIEKPQALENLDAILLAADVILVARGDLGVEMDLTAVPLIQKRIVQSAHEAGKPVIVATQMLQSMVDSASPTRAEVSDVANAILDGADACMLSGETAVGRYPVGAALILREIAENTETFLNQQGAPLPPPRLLQKTHHRTAAIAHGARAIAADLNARLVVVWSQAGGTARYLSKNRLTIPIIAFSSDPAAVRRMAMFYGVIPLRTDIPSHFDDLPMLVDRIVQEHHLAEPGDRVVIAAGAPLGIIGVTNSLVAHTVGKS